MIVAALRRFTLLLIGLSMGVALLSLLVGLALGSSATRSISVGYYLVGSFVLLFGFFAGNRGPVRQKGEQTGLGIFVPTPGRMLRWASMSEQEESINLSAVFVVLGFALILLGVATDARYSLV
jgi:hypothetical protein